MYPLRPINRPDHAASIRCAARHLAIKRFIGCCVLGLSIAVITFYFLNQ